MKHLKHFLYSLLRPSKQRMQQAINEIGILEACEKPSSQSNKSQENIILASNHKKHVS